MNSTSIWLAFRVGQDTTRAAETPLAGALFIRAALSNASPSFTPCECVRLACRAFDKRLEARIFRPTPSESSLDKTLYMGGMLGAIG